MTDLESKEQLLQALSVLDEKLCEAGSEPIEIRIVGGFALILHNVRENGFTQDIDSMTRDFEPKVKALIAQTGKELGIKLGWLNADMVLDDPEIIELIVGETNFEEYGSYEVLIVKVADLPTLLRLKIIAAGDNLLVQDNIEYERHAKDLKNLISVMGITTLDELLNVAPLADEYPELTSLLFP
jgi:hypothetical protein